MMNLFILHDSTNEDLLLGKNNSDLADLWLFYKASDDGNPVKGVQGFDAYSEEELDIFKKDIIKATTDLQKRKVEYYILIIPNKENVYREYLPDTVNISDQKGKVDKMVEYLRSEGLNNLIYPKEELIAGKKIAQTYYKQDTHWNDWGGFVGFKKYMEVVEPNYKVDEAEVLVDRKLAGKDLVQLTGLQNIFYDNIPSVNYLSDSEKVIDKKTIKLKNGNIVMTTNGNAPIDKKIMLVGDSYRNALIDFFSKTFTQCVFMSKSNYEPGMIEEYTPDVIISENVERFAEKAVGWGI